MGCAGARLTLYFRKISDVNKKSFLAYLERVKYYYLYKKRHDTFSPRTEQRKVDNPKRCHFINIILQEPKQFAWQLIYFCMDKTSKHLVVTKKATR